MDIKIYVKTEVNLTEDIDKVIKALSNMFDYDEIEIGEDHVIISGDVESITKLQKTLRDMKIRSAARKMMIKGIHENKIYFNLSKQAAFVGIPNFVEDSLSPLGEIEVKIETDNAEKFIDWIAPFIE